MRFSYKTLLTAGAVFLASALSAHAQDRTLTIYTYDSFVSEWGPGPGITEAFEAECDCTIDWVAVDDAGLLLSRLRLEGEATNADIILGLDTNLMAEAEATGLLAPHQADLSRLDLPLPWDDATFVPFDYGYFAFVYDSDALAEPPASLADLIDNPDGAKIIIQDPRTSTPGLGLMLWVKTVYGDDAPAAWQSLSGRILTVTKGWGEAYNLFLEGEAPMVLSYSTSPAYHQIIEETQRYAAAMFPEGHYIQVEVAAMTANSDDQELARQFLDFITTDGFQTVIPTGNWMYPVTDLGDALPPEFGELPSPETVLLIDPDEVAANRTDWIDEWLNAIAQ